MKKPAILILTALCAVMLVSCPIFDFFDELDTLEEGSFYAQNMINKKYYKVKAEQLHDGEKCVIWAEKGSGVNKTKAQEIAHKYDNVIRPTIVDAFSKKNIPATGIATPHPFDDMLDYANWLAGRSDKKLTILLLDIKDGYRDANTDSYVAGYFFSGNFNPKGKISGTAHYSNGRDMIYIDTYPGLEKEEEQTYATFAHELQHLISYVTSRQMKRNPLDVWIDEGLSSQAEYLYLGENPEDKVAWFSKDPKDPAWIQNIGTAAAESLARGNNFFVWGNAPGISILDEYATVYLFFRWLYLQADATLQSHIFRDIETSSDYDYRAVINAAQRINSSWNNWETLLRTWFAANYDPQNPQYGYKDDNYLQTGDGKKFDGIKIYPIAGTSISLYPGEGVYSGINNSFSPGATPTNIRYAGLINNGTPDTSPPYTGNVLLTFNANANNAAARENGQLTNAAPHITVQSPPRSLVGTASTGGFTGPYVIDAQDLLGRAQK